MEVCVCVGGGGDEKEGEEMEEGNQHGESFEKQGKNNCTN